MMLEEYVFGSCFKDDIQRLIAQKKQSGYKYDAEKYLFIQFDRFCLEQGIDSPVITKELSGKWLLYHENESKLRRSERMSALRQLALFINLQGGECYIPAQFTAKSYRVPYVMKESEIREIMRVADEYAPKINADKYKILAEEYKVLFRFIYCCGLRVSEARNLKLDNIDFENRTARILQSKGDKDRIIYIADDVCKMCQDMIYVLRHKYHFYSEYLFPSSNPDKPLQVASINQKFREFWDKTSYASDSRHPTVHSLRYSFVVSRMNIWMENGEKLTALMPYLSKYLGHESVENTYYYYHQIESAFKIVRQKDSLSGIIIPEVCYEE